MYANRFFQTSAPATCHTQQYHIPLQPLVAWTVVSECNELKRFNFDLSSLHPSSLELPGPPSELKVIGLTHIVGKYDFTLQIKDGYASAFEGHSRLVLP